MQKRSLFTSVHSSQHNNFQLIELRFNNNSLSLLQCVVCYLQHERICEFPSNHFYDDKLQADKSVKQRPTEPALQGFWPRGVKWPIVFCDVVGEEGERSSVAGDGHRQGKTDPHSKCNHKEAEKAVSHYTRSCSCQLHDSCCFTLSSSLKQPPSCAESQEAAAPLPSSHLTEPRRIWYARKLRRRRLQR